MQVVVVVVVVTSNRYNLPHFCAAHAGKATNAPGLLLAFVTKLKRQTLQTPRRPGLSYHVFLRIPTAREGASEADQLCNPACGLPLCWTGSCVLVTFSARVIAVYYDG